jgi:threonine synthase
MAATCRSKPGMEMHILIPEGGISALERLSINARIFFILHSDMAISL